MDYRATSLLITALEYLTINKIVRHLLPDIRDLSSAPHIPGRSDEFYDCSGMLGKSLPIPTPAISIQDRHQEEELVEVCTLHYII